MEALSLPHIIVIGAVLILLFGGKKIPEVMRGLGEGIKNFKEGMRGDSHAPTQTTQVSQPPVTSTPAVEEKK
jgi:sec-independent protein translocase protein TatA